MATAETLTTCIGLELGNTNCRLSYTPLVERFQEPQLVRFTGGPSLPSFVVMGPAGIKTVSRRHDFITSLCKNFPAGSEILVNPRSTLGDPRAERALQALALRLFSEFREAFGIDQIEHGEYPAAVSIPAHWGITHPASQRMVDANGQPVIGWQGWQETIAVIGLLALWERTGELDIGDAARTIAKVVTHHCWQLGLGGLRHAYAVAWNNGEPFAPGAWPSSLNQNGEGWTSFVYVSGACSTWTIAAADAMAAWDNNARAIVAAHKPPQTITEARWRAL